MHQRSPWFRFVGCCDALIGTTQVCPRLVARGAISNGKRRQCFVYTRVEQKRRRWVGCGPEAVRGAHGIGGGEHVFACLSMHNQQWTHLSACMPDVSDPPPPHTHTHTPTSPPPLPHSRTCLCTSRHHNHHLNACAHVCILRTFVEGFVSHTNFRMYTPNQSRRTLRGPRAKRQCSHHAHQTKRSGCGMFAPVTSVPLRCTHMKRTSTHCRGTSASSTCLHLAPTTALSR
jgi:hypothetical protein